MIRTGGSGGWAYTSSYGYVSIAERARSRMLMTLFFGGMERGMGGAGAMRGGGLAPRGAPAGAALEGGSNEKERGFTVLLKPPGPRGPAGKSAKTPFYVHSATHARLAV